MIGFNKMKMMRALATSSNYHTTSSLMARRSRLSRMNVGIGRRLEAFDSHEEFKNEVEDEEDINNNESDFMNVHEQYDQHLSEIRRQKKKISNIMTAKKFFKIPKQPVMLTWNEREQIRFLHQKDPDEWTVEKLSLTFPATEEAIHKVLKSKWKPLSLEQVGKINEAVKRNWNLLKEEKLDADPAVIEHLKKFTMRKDEIISFTNSDVSGLLEPKKEVTTWNNGQMRSIIENYEKSIKELESKHFESKKAKQISGVEVKIENSVTLRESNPTLQISSEHNKTEASENKETYKNKVEYPGKLLTFSQFENEYKQEMETTSKPDPLTGIGIEPFKTRLDNIIIKKPIKNNHKPKKIDIQKSENNNDVILRLQKMAGYDVLNSTVTHDRIKKGKTTFKNDEDVGLSEEENSQVPMVKEIQDIQYPVPKEKNIRLSYTENIQMEELGDHKLNIQKNQNTMSSFEQEEKKEIYEIKNKKTERLKHNKQSIDRIPKSISTLEELGSTNRDKELGGKFSLELTQPKELYEFKDEREKEEYDVIENRIQDTFFWQNTENVDLNFKTSENKLMIDKKSKEDKNVCYDYDYPERINVPHGKRHSGLTFQVKDCFYDDDGEFLYRVPGLK